MAKKTPNYTHWKQTFTVRAKTKAALKRCLEYCKAEAAAADGDAVANAAPAPTCGPGEPDC